RAHLMKAQKMESLGTLAGGIAHDFNNILTSIIGFTELALDEAQKGTSLEDSLQEVNSAGQRAKELVKQILAFARQSDEQRSPIQPSIIAKEVLKFVRSTIPTTITIEKGIASDALIMGDATQVYQVLMNLCANAAHAMEDSGGVLTVSLKDVVIDKAHALKTIGLVPGRYVELAVSDTGVGIAPDIINSIFEPYFTTKGVGEGTGLGLATVHGIIESHGGKITVDSRLGKGTTFTIYLPSTRKHGARSPGEPGRLPQGREHILFVDDELAITKMNGTILERLGYSVTTRTSSIEALELFRAKPDAFDLVITDMTMPNMTGAELAIELMKIRPDIPIILSTGYSKKISDQLAWDIGIKAFTYKPMVRADLAKTVRSVLDEAKEK
ncbi:MAG: ATP-binding protein, partial [Desulfosarcinaceae bacterium]